MLKIKTSETTSNVILYNQLNWYFRCFYQFLRLKRTLLLLIASLFLCSILPLSSQVKAASPEYLNFQGRILTTTNGLVTDGDYNIEFKLYNALTSSGSSQGTCSGDTACKWVETRTNANRIRVSNGYFNVNLGSVTSLSSTNFSEQLYLTLRIGGTNVSPSWDTEISPRIVVTSVPYAFSAKQLSATSGSITNTLNFNTPATSNKTINLPNASGTVAVSASGNVALDTNGNITLSGQIPFANGGTNATTRQSALNNLTTFSAAGDLLYYNGSDATTLSRGTSGQCLMTNTTTILWSTCGSSTTLQSTYDVGNSITTTSNRNLTLNLSDSAVDSNFDINVATGSTSNIQFNRSNGAGSSDPSSLVVIDNLDVDRILPKGLTVQSASGGLNIALDVSDAEINYALSIGSNDILTTTATISSSEISLLDSKNNTLVDIDDAINTSITGTGSLVSGSIIASFGAIDVGADNITTTGTLSGGVLQTTSTANIVGELTLGSSGTSGILKLSDGSSNYVSLLASSVTSDFSITLPSSIGSANQCLANSATAGVLAFISCSGGLTGSGTANRLTYWSSSGTLTSASSIYTDANSIAVNTTTPIGKLTVTGSNTTSGNLNGIYVDGTYNGTLSSNSNYYAGVNIVTTFSPPSGSSTLYGLYSRPNITTDYSAGTVVGVYGSTNHTAGGDLSSAIGGLFGINSNGGGDIYNGYALYVQDASASSSVDVNYGIFIDNINNGNIANFAIYSSGGASYLNNSSNIVLTLNRQTTDGIILAFSQDGNLEGNVSVSGNTVSYNAFTGSHYGVTRYEENLTKGELVTLTNDVEQFNQRDGSEQVYSITRSTSENDSKILGSFLGILDPNQPFSRNNPFQIMAVGNGYMWVADNGKNISQGDYLVSSDTAGHAELDNRSWETSNIIARSAESVDWNAVYQYDGSGKRHKLISVFYENFSRQNYLNVSDDGGFWGDLTINGQLTVKSINISGEIITSGNSPKVYISSGFDDSALSITGNDSTGLIEFTPAVSSNSGSELEFVLEFNSQKSTDYNVILSNAVSSSGVEYYWDQANSDKNRAYIKLKLPSDYSHPIKLSYFVIGY